MFETIKSWFRKTPVQVLAAETPNSADTRANAPFWHRLGDTSVRDLGGIEHDRMVRESVKAAQVNGTAKGHVRLVTAATVGGEEKRPNVTSTNKDVRDLVQARLDTFWKENELSRLLCDFQNGLSTTGSLVTTLHTGEGSRLTRVGWIDPECFTGPGVLRDPGNVLRPIAVIRKDWWDPTAVIANPIIHSDGMVSEVFNVPEGSKVQLPLGGEWGATRNVTVGAKCFYTGINRMAPSQSTGISDLYASLDILHMHDELVFKSTERSVNIGSFSWHLNCPAGTPQDVVDDLTKKVRRAVESGDGQLIGTVGAELTAPAPNLMAGDWHTQEGMALAYALQGLNLWPPHVFSDNGATNVTVAAEQGSPIANLLLDRQAKFKAHLLHVCWYAVKQYPEVAAALEQAPDIEIHLPLPVIVARDTTRESNVLLVEANSLQMAFQNGWITHAAAQREYQDSANRYGFEFKEEDIPDSEEWLEKNAQAQLGGELFQFEPQKVSDGTPDMGSDGGDAEAAA